MVPHPVRRADKCCAPQGLQAQILPRVKCSDIETADAPGTPGNQYPP